MKRFAGILVLGLALTAPAPAHANDPRTNEMLALAAQHHGRVASCPVQAGLFDLAPDRAGQVMATNPCTIMMNRAFFPGGAYSESPDDVTFYCAVIVHEYGHVLGLRFDNPSDPGHSTDPNSIMYQRVIRPELVPGCERYAASPERLRALWPCWAKSHPRVRSLYFNGKTAKAKALYRRLVHQKKIKRCP